MAARKSQIPTNPEPMHRISVSGKDLVDAYHKLNWEMLNQPTGMVMPGRDYTRVIPNMSMHGRFGIGKSLRKRLPPFYTDLDRRANLLRKRYVQPDLWDEGLTRLKDRRGRLAKSNPLSFVFNFQRRATTERKVPAGGGCLQTITFIWFQGQWGLHVYLRASEISGALAGDLWFVKQLVNEIVSNIDGLKAWDFNKVPVQWDIALASQMKAKVAVWLTAEYGEDFFKEYVSETIPQNLTTQWQAEFYNHFWNEFIYPERISWSQRRKSSEIFLDMTDTDWRVLRDDVYKGKLQYAGV